MAMWIVIIWTVIAFLWASVIYLANKLPKLFDFSFISNSELKQFLFGLAVVLILGALLTFFINLASAAVCLIYFGLIWAVSDFVFYLLQKIFDLSFEYYYSGWIAFAVTFISLSIGFFLDYNVWQTNYHLSTNKKVSPLKIALIADAHLGTTFNGDGFGKHIAKIQEQNPDLLVIAGDFVDDETHKKDMVKACEILKNFKSKYGVYLVFGNHDKGYNRFRAFSSKELIDELKKNNVKVLFDEVISLNDDYYLIGRKDYSEIHEKIGTRLSMSELTENLDKNKYMIVLDHQPTDYKNQAEAEVDLVLSGHTHGGQLFPFNQVGKWIGANDLVYGHEKRNKTDFIVTSGISDWAIKFKTGTKSEFVIINLKKGK